MNEGDYRQIAEEIFEALKIKSSPLQSTWGNMYAKAWQSLFTTYREDMIKTIMENLQERRL